MRGRIGVLAPLANRNFRFLAVGHLTSLMGDGFFRAALAVQVIAIVGANPGAIAAVGMAWGLGQTVALPFGGWAGDRFERRKVLIYADGWRSMMIGGIGVLSVTGNLELWHMVVLGFGFGIGNGFFNPTAMAFVPDLVPDDMLTKANSFLGVARPGMLYIVGPVLGAGLVWLGGPGLAFLMDGATFVVSLAMLSRIQVPVRQEPTPASTPLRDIVEGMRYVAGTRWAWPWLVGAGLGTLMFHGPFDVLIPVLLTSDFGMHEGQVALTIAGILAAGGLGALVAGTVIGQWDLPKRFITTLYVAEACAIAALMIIGLMTAPWQAVIAGGIIFTLFAVTDIIWSTTMQRYVPRRLLGRVASVDWFTSVSLAPLSMGVAWGLDGLVGARGGLVVAGIAGALALLALLLVPGTRDPERGLVEAADATNA
jgi:hypothetical protein